MDNIGISQNIVRISKDKQHLIEPIASYHYQCIVNNNVAKGYNQEFVISELERCIVKICVLFNCSRNDCILKLSIEFDVKQIGNHKQLDTQYGFACDEKLHGLMNAIYKFCTVYDIKYKRLTFMSCQHNWFGTSGIDFYLDAFVNILKFLKKQNNEFNIIRDEFFENVMTLFGDYCDSCDVEITVAWTIPQSKITYFTDEFERLILLCPVKTVGCFGKGLFMT